jgi:ABC-type microcin C transport system permease subunit YejB
MHFTKDGKEVKRSATVIVLRSIPAFVFPLLTLRALLMFGSVFTRFPIFLEKSLKIKSFCLT